ncbi:MAG: DUF3857 domain-containing protein [Saprospiraceae bacterium]
MRTLTSLFCVCFALLIFGQSNKPVKYGKVDPQDLHSTICPIDSNAHSYYIFDIGQSTFLVLPDKLKVTFERHFRIKILDKSAFDEGTIAISLYTNGLQKEEDLIDLKAITYHEESGQIVESKLEKSAIFKEKTSEHINTVKFTMPNIRPGSVIEVKYQIHSDFIFNFQGWTFQHDIPVLQSQYITVIPDIIHYNPHFRGYSNISTSTEERRKNDYNFSEIITYYSGKNIKAFPDEPYLFNKNNYRTRVEFELAYTDSQQGRKDYTNTWEGLNTLLLEHNQFGVQLNKSNYFKDEITAISQSWQKPMEKAFAAFNLIKSRMKWNGVESIYTSRSIKKAYEERLGNVAEINLALIAMLRELDIQAYPVILSTRENGFLLKIMPTLSSMNYVIAVANIDGKKVFLDASDPLATPTILPPKVMNGAARLVNETLGEWVDLIPTGIAQNQVNYKLAMSEDGLLKGKYEEKNFNFAAYKMRQELKDSVKIKKYFESIRSKFPDITLSNIRLLDNDDLTKDDVIIQSDIEINTGMDLSSDLYYFTPLQMEKLTETPFKAKEREYPVEYEYPWMSIVTMEIKIPESINIESLPKPGRFQNEDKSVKFTFVTEKLSENLIKVNSMISVAKPVFEAELYDGLKDLFSHVVAKHSEQIVLKKKP